MIDDILETMEAIAGGIVAGVIRVFGFLVFVFIVATTPIWILPFLIRKCCQDE